MSLNGEIIHCEVACPSAVVHQNVKDAILLVLTPTLIRPSCDFSGWGSELDTRLVMRSLRNTERVLTNAAVERLVLRGRGKVGLSAEEGRYFMAIASLDVQLRRLISLNDQLEIHRAALEPKISAVSEELEKQREELRELS